MDGDIVLDGVREYAEGLPVKLMLINDRFVVRGLNEAGFNCVDIDLDDLLQALKDLGYLDRYR